MSMVKKLRDRLFQAGVFDAIYLARPRHLTTLAYHRVTDPSVPGFDTFKPNVSATPAAFAEQMDFVRQRFNIVAMEDVIAWLRGVGSLPVRPMLITFDDGYRDNLTNALPVLQQRNLPATIFLTTGCVESAEPFWWDLVACCFAHTPWQAADLPLIGWQQWSNEAERTLTMGRLIDRLRSIPNDAKQAAVQQLPRLLEVTISDHRFAELFLTWEEVRAMTRHRITMGAHTHTHPIMTRIPLEQARAEAVKSRECIEAQTGQLVHSFAYTNGLEADFNPTVQAMLRQEGFVAAFTLLPGAASLARVRQEPMAIRRILVSHKDTLPRFAAKLVGRP
ncbi:MAG: polysaccharide deacetylase family protein [Chloroflexaceae bacterium]|nr:polysaccharide deacetylase family protein [Chloroflexaceae bacterium]